MSVTLYQKYRPYTFNEVIGQDVIVNILKNSISNNQVQGTYIFNGPRGTGKTSIAKIFSRAINCSCNDLLEGTCENCLDFKQSNEHHDIYELDAASNNGVDDIRQIIDNSYFQPVKLSKKVYIIDEVHMLSKGAFNALLKTLEEAPNHVVFILATTEINQVPATILSRCQRFDFNRVNDDMLEKHLSLILQKESIGYNQNSLDMIIGLSDGCVRDALSLLQKVITGESNINEEITKNKLNILSDNEYEILLDLIIQKNQQNLMSFWNELYIKGISEQGFLIGFQKYLKEKMIKSGSSTQLLDIVYKINDLEKRAIYTARIKDIIDITFLNMTHGGEVIIEQEVSEEITKEEVVEESISVNETNNILNFVNSSDKYKYVFNKLDQGSKEDRIMLTKQFTIINTELNIEKKFGLAKFFTETQIGLVTQEDIVGVLDSALINDYETRIEEIQSVIQTSKNIILLDVKTWQKLINAYKEQLKLGTAKEEDPITKQLEEKLNKKVTLLEE